MTTQRLRLLSIDRPMFTAAQDILQFTAEYRLKITQPQLEHLREVIQQSLDFYQKINAVEPWIGYVTIDDAAGMAVGSCGFKGNPSEEGSVEIAYGTFPEHEGKGYATAAARELFSIASTCPEVRTVIAHTLPERNASCRVLEKNGFEKVGEVIDPEDGPVWQWQIRS